MKNRDVLEYLKELSCERLDFAIIWGTKRQIRKLKKRLINKTCKNCARWGGNESHALYWIWSRAWTNKCTLTDPDYSCKHFKIEML